MKKLIFILILFCSIQGFGQIKGYWRLNGNSNDASGNGNNGTDTNITYSQANGVIGQGAGLNGTTSHIQLPTTSFPTGNLPVTLSGWFSVTKQPVAGEELCIIGYGTGATGRQHYIGYANVGTGAPVIIFSGWGGTYDVGIFFTATLNKKYHVVGVYDGYKPQLYLNGDFKAIQTQQTTFNVPASNAYIGRTPNGKHYPGGVDEIKMDNSVWSPAMVKNEYSRVKGFF